MRKTTTYIDSINIRVLLFIVICLVIAFVGLKSFISYKNVELDDLSQVEGTIAEYHLAGGRSSSLYIKLQEYYPTFFVSSVQLQALDYSKFNANEKRGSSVTFYVSKEDSRKLLNNEFNTDNKITVYGIFTKNSNYLTIEEYRNAERSNIWIGLILGIVFIFVAALFVVIFRNMSRY